MLLQAAPAVEASGGGLRILLVFLLVVAPIYLFLVIFVRIVREAYGFTAPADEGPPVRVCPGCDTSIVEQDFRHCPSCGALLPPPADDGAEEAVAASVPAAEVATTEQATAAEDANATEDATAEPPPPADG